MYRALLALLGSLLLLPSTTTAVTLSNYRRRDCSSAGGAEICYNTAPLPGCCGNTANRYFVSGDCSGCTSTDIHFLFGPGASGACSVARTGSNENTCVNAQNAKGHGWCRICNTRAVQMASEGASEKEWADPKNGVSAAPGEKKECNLPNVITKDGVRFWRVNYDVPRNVTDVVMDWYDDVENMRYTAGVIPEVILPYETSSPWESEKGI